MRRTDGRSAPLGKAAGHGNNDSCIRPQLGADLSEKIGMTLVQRVKFSDYTSHSHAKSPLLLKKILQKWLSTGTKSITMMLKYGLRIRLFHFILFAPFAQAKNNICKEIRFQ
jgi:hypothetical protein